MNTPYKSLVAGTLLSLAACGGSPTASAPTAQSARADAVVNGGNKIYTAADFAAVPNTPSSVAMSNAAAGTACVQFNEQIDDVCEQAASAMNDGSSSDVERWIAKLNAARQNLNSCLAEAEPGQETPPISDYEFGK